MRALIVCLALGVVVMICMAFVVLLARIDLSPAILLQIAIGIFAVGALFATIAALGPKSAPTPLLTPTLAGTIAVVFATVAFIFGTIQFDQASRPATHGSAPAKVAPSTAVAQVQPLAGSQAGTAAEPQTAPR